MAEWTYEDLTKCRKALRQGWTCAQIAQLIGRTERAVYQFCYRNGIPMGKRGPKPQHG